MGSPRRFLIMAGGTGGHVFPALATARQLQSAGHEIHWLGSRQGMEADIVINAGLPISLITVGGLRGKGRLALVKAPVRLLRALGQALLVLRRVRPDCVLGMGGFVTGPGGLAAKLLGIPLVIHEQNAIPGLTNRLLSRLATRVLVAFPDTGLRPGEVATGNPVRPEIARLPEPELRLKPERTPFRLLVVGGSLGALAINEIVPRALAQMVAEERPQVRHQTGRRHLDSAQAAYKAAGVEGEVVPFIDDMQDAYGWADLVLCRSGALTISELCAAGAGAILVPYPHAVDDHQTANAAFLVERGGALLIQQQDLSVAGLAEQLGRFAKDRNQLLVMANAARTLARPDATETVARICTEVAYEKNNR